MYTLYTERHLYTALSTHRSRLPNRLGNRADIQSHLVSDLWCTDTAAHTLPLFTDALTLPPIRCHYLQMHWHRLPYAATVHWCNDTAAHTLPLCTDALTLPPIRCHYSLMHWHCRPYAAISTDALALLPIRCRYCHWRTNIAPIATDYLTSPLQLYHIAIKLLILIMKCHYFHY